MDLPPGYDLAHLAAEYFGAVTWMDTAVGRVLDAVAVAGIEGDTLVVFASDHGENLGVARAGPEGHAQRREPARAAR